MLPKLESVTSTDLEQALASRRCRSATERIRLPLEILRELNHHVTHLARGAGAGASSLRAAQVRAAVAITLATRRQVQPERWGLAVGFAVAEQWLEKNKVLVPDKADRCWARLDAAARKVEGKDDVDLIAATTQVIEEMVIDPLTVFVAGPVTAATHDETDQLVGISTVLRQELVHLRVRLYSAPEQSDPRQLGEFADDDSWRPNDEHWIRRSDLVVILHPRAATGLGVVHELATAACVPVLLMSDKPVSPMVARSLTAERLLESHGIAKAVGAYIERHRPAMLQRRHDVREMTQRWRKGRLRLQRDIEALSDASLAAWTPTTMTLERLREVSGDDYAFGSLTDFERLQLRQAFTLPKLRPLHDTELRALHQATRNHGWSDEEVWQVELAGRELLASAAGEEWHYSRPHDPAFWEAIHRGLLA
jgi:hypothetical protein